MKVFRALIDAIRGKPAPASLPLNLPPWPVPLNLPPWPVPVIPPAASPFPIPDEAIDLLKHFESCLEPIGNGRFAAYADPAHGWNVPTIGWGTIAYEDGRKVKRGDIITQARADELLLWEVREKAAAVRRLIKVPVTPGQFGALVSFAYNVGEGNLSRSTLLKKLNAGDYMGAADEFWKWNKAAGKPLRGLTRRRESERRLFLGLRPAIVPA